MNGGRRLSQAISEGDGISVLVEVEGPDAALRAAAQGAEGLVVRHAVDVRSQTGLPLVWYGRVNSDTTRARVDAVVLSADVDPESLADLVDEVHHLGLECVVRVKGEHDLERVLRDLDPEILLLAAADDDADDDDRLEQLLALLPDVPAGKLAIAELRSASRAHVEELERAGVDAVVVDGTDVDVLVAGSLPDV